MNRLAFRIMVMLQLAIMFAVIWMTLPAGAARAQEPAQKFTAMDVFRIQLPMDVQISPDGKKIAYVRQFNDVMTDARYSSLWIINSDGSNHHALTTGTQHDSSPRWSPDGSRLAYLSVVGGKLEIVVRSVMSGKINVVTDVDEAPSEISWSPDGKYIAYSSLVPAAPPKVADIPAPPAGAKWADVAQVHDKFLFRLTGAKYVKPGFYQIFLVSSDGGPSHQITFGDFANGGTALHRNLARWSPDNKHLIISINRHPESDFEYFDTEIYEVALADGSIRALTDRYGPDNSPIISPNGRLIAYIGYDDHKVMYQSSKVYVMNIDGSGARSISDSLELDALSDPKWAPDNSGVYFQYDEHGDTKLGFLSLKGEFRKCADHLSAGFYNMTGGFYSVSQTGDIALTIGSAGNPADIAMISEGTVRTLTSLNRDFLAQRRVGRTEEIWYASSLDRREIQGWIVYPPDFDPARKYPLILEIHGGPNENQGGDRFDLEKQIWAAQGYVVFCPNFRGSDSYGQEFANLIDRAYPGDDFYDLMSGVDAVLSKGFVDPHDLFVVGGSGGGTGALWVVGHTDRFRAAAALYPIVNFYSAVLTSWYPVFTKWWFSGAPWDHSGDYMRRSPISYVGNVKTPTLLMTGELDYNAPLSEAIQYFQALKLRNVESVLVTVPEEGHFLFARPTGDIDRISYVTGWFDRHRSKPVVKSGAH